MADFLFLYTILDNHDYDHRKDRSLFEKFILNSKCKYKKTGSFC